MKEIRREKVEKSEYFVFVASDGTEFSFRDECEKYEESALGVLMTKIKPLVIKEICTEDIHGYGSCDETVWVLKPTTQEHADIILQMYLLINPHMKNDDYAHYVERAKKLIQRALDENDILFVGRGYEMDSFWFVGTRNSMKEQLDSFFPSEKKDENA